MRYLQLRLWSSPRIDLAAKLRVEKEMGTDVFYHWNGVPLIMRERIPNRGEFPRKRTYEPI
jgi:hypothetical protein